MARLGAYGETEVARIVAFAPSRFTDADGSRLRREFVMTSVGRVLTRFADETRNAYSIDVKWVPPQKRTAAYLVEHVKGYGYEPEAQ